MHDKKMNVTVMTPVFTVHHFYWVWKEVNYNFKLFWRVFNEHHDSPEESFQKIVHAITVKSG